MGQVCRWGCVSSWPQSVACAKIDTSDPLFNMSDKIIPKINSKFTCDFKNKNNQTLGFEHLGLSQLAEEDYHLMGLTPGILFNNLQCPGQVPWEGSNQPPMSRVLKFKNPDLEQFSHLTYNFSSFRNNNSGNVTQNLPMLLETMRQPSYFIPSPTWFLQKHSTQPALSWCSLNFEAR